MHRATHQSEKSATSTTPTSLFQKMHQKDHLAQFQCKIIKVHYFCVRKLNNAAELLSIVSPRFYLLLMVFVNNSLSVLGSLKKALFFIA